ncbi:MAG: homoserine kinase [Zymomonas mobilis subsp. pomaceae]|uniref:homoserine kinase n=1 Tax=Zymomonas mobilis TaxID=542 RepID=UPI0039E87B48
MAVYTSVSNDEVSSFLALYPESGRLLSVKGITEGVENSNYLITTDRRAYILTLYEKRVNPEELPFFMALTDHLAAENLPVPKAWRSRDGKQIQTLAGRPACLIEFLQGRWTPSPSPAQTQATGEMLGKMHNSLTHFNLNRKNSLDLPSWHELFHRCGIEALNSIEAGMGDEVKQELAYLDQFWPKDLPHSVIHADLFPDNVLFEGERLKGVIDFYFACTEIRAWDLAITYSAWCFDSDNRFLPEHAHALIKGYHQTFTLSEEERAAFPVLLRGAALRFLLTRAWDWLNTPKEALVVPKDPRDFFKRMLHYRQADLTALGF